MAFAFKPITTTTGKTRADSHNNGEVTMLKKSELKAIRDAFEESQGHDLRLSDDAVSAIVERIGDDWDEMDADEQIKLFVTGEASMSKIAIADPSITAMVNRMDAVFNEELDACVDATLKNKTTAVDILAQFVRTMPKAMLDATPYPGTNEDDVKGTNYKPDIVERETPTGKIRTVFVHDLVQATPKGKAFQADIDDVTAELGKSAGQTRFKGKNKKELASIKSLATAGRNAMRSMFGRALELHHKFNAINEMPLVKIQWINGYNKDKCTIMPSEYGKGKIEGQMITQAPKPLWMYPVIDGKEQGGEGRDFSITQIIAMEPDKAMRMPQGGTMAELIESARGEPVTPETTVLSPEAMDTEVVTIWANLSNRENMAALRKRLVSPDNETAREAYCALYLLLKPVYMANQTWYEKKLETDTEGGPKTEVA